MSRLFNGTTDLMTYALGASGGVNNWGFGTVLIVARIMGADTGWMSLVELENAAGTGLNGVLARHTSTGTLLWANQASSEISGSLITAVAADGWCIWAMTKATGTAAVNLHKIPIGGARVSEALGSLANSSSIVNGRIKLGGDDDPANIRLAVAAVLPGIVLTTTQLDGIATAKTTASIVALTDANSWVVDDSNAFATDLKANHNRSAISGTTNDADNPSGWVYGLSGGGATVTGVPASATGDNPAAVISAGATIAGVAATAAGDNPIAVATASAGTDTFEEPDSQLDTPWAAFGGKTLPFIVSGDVFAAADLTVDAAAYSVAQPADMLSEITLAAAPTTTTNLTFDAYTRISALTSGADYYVFRMVGTNWRIIKRTGGGAESTVSQVARGQTISTITGLRMTTVGTTLTGYAKVSGSWTQVIQTTDASITAGGYAGFGTSLASGGANPVGIEGASWGPMAVSATVTAVPAVALGSAPVAAVTGTGSATVTAVPATAAGDNPAAVIGAGATVSGVVALGLGSAPPANSLLSAVVGAPAVVALGSAPIATVSSAGNATVTGVPATALGSAAVPVVNASSTVGGVSGLALGSALPSSLSLGWTVAGVASFAAGQAPRPSISPAPAGAGGSLVSVATTFAEDSA